MATSTPNRLAGRLDADLHLLDRQIVDSEGAFVGKVDDLELTEQGGRLLVTGLLLGPAAWLPRLSRRHSRSFLAAWRVLAPAWSKQDVPGWISLDDVERVASDVRLRRPRDGVVEQQADPDRHHRVGILLESDVVRPDGEPLRTQVRDLRLEPGERWPEVYAVVVGRGRPSTLLGYDREKVRGPVLLAQAIRALNVTGELSMDDVDIDWDDLVVRTRAEPGPLTRLEG